MLNDNILFIDGEAIVVDKPAGLPVDPPRDGSMSVANQLQSLAFGFKRWPHPVHRLDRDTSGCLLLARHPKAHGRFTQAFEAGSVGKIYLAVLDGVPDAESGLVDMALSKTSTRETGWRMVADPKGKAARSAWRVLQTVDGRALVEFRPETGRTHQIRVHAASGIGVPIIGDPVYGKGDRPMLLHAASLTVPRDNKPPIEARAPLPPTFAALGFADPTVPLPVAAINPGPSPAGS
ncbi:tRNA pseudouridine32 synthase / 23S rRNA pseudouridine746 synthase [Sphingomonas sp. YR710]|jgi:tRNA pseudouridine32 synthase/23S rRNA pseudouridine746 synthase|uniref:RluA family pseudouridine synthase n=1 Tax=Sphingomonas sp. YR710 TaxID=1882773 RepID=UPI00087FE82B|nr:RNA pseudouridine synthase [Sphingomonas sp. YR710]SDD56772.1 tRNA pseudouridine32 synthase / 23S rRNA pseudouridine746 synthase [Sphingomonas sp. YR710]